MAKKLKPTEEDVAAETPPTDIEEIVSAAEEIDQPLTSDDRGEPGGHLLTQANPSEPEPDEPPLAPEPKPAKVWKPGSCINCGETTTDAVQVIAVDRFRCTRCKHEWTLAEEQAPFRRLARR